MLTTPLYIASFTAGTWILCTVLLAATAVCQYAYIPAAAAVTQNMMEPRMRASATAVTYLVYTLVGKGGGPLIVGAMSDHFSRGGSATGVASVAGAAGAAQGLEVALIVMALVYWLSAAFLVWSARSLARELRGEV